MPWCRSMWITRNRANPGNRIVDGYWGPGTGLWCFEPLIHKKWASDHSDQTLMRHSRMLTKQHVFGAPLCKGWLPSWHIENILKWSKRTFLNMPYGQYPRNRFVMDLSHDKPYIYILSLILYKNLLFPAMYSRLEWAPSSDQIVPPISVIWVRRGPWSLYWLSYCKPVCLLIDWLLIVPLHCIQEGLWTSRIISWFSTIYWICSPELQWVLMSWLSTQRQTVWSTLK